MAAPAKAGSIAPIDVFVPPQNTGLGPEKTSFFQALSIATKISKGTIEILSEVHLIKKNDKVGFSEAALLQMLKVFPFSYGLKIRHGKTWQDPSPTYMCIPTIHTHIHTRCCLCVYELPVLLVCSV